MSALARAKAQLSARPRSWLVTGAAGFIGSHLVESLLRLRQHVTGLDNFSTGYRHNLDQVRDAVGPLAWSGFRFIEGDIRAPADCERACAGVDFVLHHAALGSVPRSIVNPAASNDTNVCGGVNMLVAARDAGVERFIYAASSSTYGDHPALPKVEAHIGRPLSPYAVTKYVNELYAEVFARCYGMDCIGLRYFNVFGRRQDADGDYAAVIPRWIAALLRNEEVCIYGDGENSRDFCYVDNVAQANLLAAAAGGAASNQVYNVAVDDSTTLNQLYWMLRGLLDERFPYLCDHRPTYLPAREGDIRHSRADVAKAERLLGYQPSHRIEDGLREAIGWYVDALTRKPC